MFNAETAHTSPSVTTSHQNNNILVSLVVGGWNAWEGGGRWCVRSGQGRLGWVGWHAHPTVTGWVGMPVHITMSLAQVVVITIPLTWVGNACQWGWWGKLAGRWQVRITTAMVPRMHKTATAGVGGSVGYTRGKVGGKVWVKAQAGWGKARCAGNKAG